MIDYEQAKTAFENYMQQYDLEDPKIKLKWLHTYGVVNCAYHIAQSEKMSSEDIELARVIALLHDIGRFEQIKRYQSFSDKNIDHAHLAVEYLFHENHIRDFIDDEQYDFIIKPAVEWHSRFKLDEIYEPNIRKHVYLIRDADKLDNFRVKNTESFETMLDISLEEISKQKINDYIFDQIMCSQLILSEKRVTSVDVWASYIAFVFDLHFKSSFQYLIDTQYISKNIDRIPYQDRYTKKKMELIKKHCQRYINYKSVTGQK